eukprot:826625-Pleurochrysis_carterae.AAC.1
MQLLRLAQQCCGSAFFIKAGDIVSSCERAATNMHIYSARGPAAACGSTMLYSGTQRKGFGRSLSVTHTDHVRTGSQQQRYVLNYNFTLLSVSGRRSLACRWIVSDA